MLAQVSPVYCIQVDPNTVLPGENKNIEEIVCTFHIAQLCIREPWKPTHFDQKPWSIPPKHDVSFQHNPRLA